MRHSATPGPVFSLYLSIVLFLVLVSISGKVYAKRGCASFGHSCYGGHGKRFDSSVQQNTLQQSVSQNFQQSELPLPNDELFYVFPDDKFRKRSNRSFMRIRKTARRIGPYSLLFLVDLWIASHRRLHSTKTDTTDK